MDKYRRTDQEVREVISEVGLERLVAVGNDWFVELGFPDQIKHCINAALTNGSAHYRKETDL